MSEEKHEIEMDKKNEIVTEEEIKEEVVKDKEEKNDENIMKEECAKEHEDNIKISFNDTFMGSLIDTIVMAGISLVGFFIFDNLILRLLGFRFIKEYRGTGLLIIFILVAILYPAIMESKKGNTIGKKSSKISLYKAEK
ncbi:hypothetical protein BD780_002688 [Clostridium tetanomorphum]|uniref:RDD family protein n=2 Tax=Clostridium tetanomorphum TaxID=1553 RepID=A0A923EEQ0_CLOTT|nr:RDD family protein [Clostridium tetanomorphum]KAJ50623.1 hypothetical protein CTM_16802 [Clostridium tetanomorphum DSM 665]MBC2399693.1 RDD family protein [Clostridium tetanomorphum]MBP1862697.1 hypothetical protein [Clostridium tetanomorphum]NRS85463.1 hypothetical protein [Clostridium tetanomorphum]NRZ98576.1 hypothetical protein [Clostridium tetanomorphum]